MGIILTLFPAAIAAYVLKKKTADTYAITALVESCIIYLFGICGFLNAGLYVVLAATVISVPIAVIMLIFRIRRKEKFYSYDTFLLLLSIVFFAVMNYGRDVTSKDDMTFYTLSVKNYLYFGTMFSPYDTSIGTHPPLLRLWQLFAMKTWVGYSDSICLWANSVLFFAALLPIAGEIKEDRYHLRKTLLAFALFLSPMVVNANPYTTLGPDIFLGALLFAGIYHAFQYTRTDENWCLFASVTSLVALTLAKQAGFLFAVVGIWICLSMILGKSEGLTFVRKHKSISIYLIYLIPSLAVLSWYHLHLYFACMLAGTIGAFLLVVVESKWSEWFIDHKAYWIPVLLVGIVLVCGVLVWRIPQRAYPFRVLASHLEELFMPQDSQSQILPLTNGAIVLLSAVCWGIVRRRFCSDRDAEAKENSQFIAVFSKLIVGFVLTWLAFYVMFIVIIGPANQMGTIPIPRYLIPIPYTLAMFWLLFLVQHPSPKLSVESLLGCAIAAFLITGNSPDFLRDMADRHAAMRYYAFEDAGITLMPGDTVYFVDQVEEDKTRDRQFYSYMIPATSNFRRDYLLGAGSFTADLTSTSTGEAYTAAEWAAILTDYKYLYLQTYDDDFIARYGELFEDQQDIATGNVYYIRQVDSDTVKLSLAERRN